MYTLSKHASINQATPMTSSCHMNRIMASPRGAQIVRAHSSQTGQGVECTSACLPVLMAFTGLHGAELLPWMCRDHITTEDLECFLPPDKAANALSVLDIDGDGKISLADMRNAIVSIYKERTNLASTLKARPCSDNLESTV